MTWHRSVRHRDGRAVEYQDDADRRVGQKLPHDIGMLQAPDLIFASTKLSRPPHVLSGCHAFQADASATTFSPDEMPGSSMARRDKASAWSAIYLL
jgi:hypothetical protein